MNAISNRLGYLLAGAALGVALTGSQGVFAAREERPPLPLEYLLAFSDVFDQIKQAYVEPVEDKELLENAIRGMLAGLDPHSAYLVPQEADDLHATTSGRFGGLGIEVSLEDGFVKVIAPFDDTPADRAGVKAGDVIIRLDETPVKGMNLNDAVKRMRGKPGTDIILTIVREGETAPLKLTVTRDIIRVTSVKGRLLESDYGYVRITQFQSPTPDNMRQKLSRLKSENGGKLKGLVLNLRNNPGGALDAAIGVSDAFLTDGVIVSTKGRVKSAQSVHHATPTDVLDGAPIVVLVNRGSASASEIVAGALQDHKRAVIMGGRTFGKGSVQNVINLKNKSALKLTTARYYTPSGASIQAKGISPDIVLKRVTVAADPEGEGLTEADLSGHLGDGGAGEKAGGKNKTATRKAPDPNLAKDDYAVYEALNLLRGLGIYGVKSS